MISKKHLDRPPGLLIRQRGFGLIGEPSMTTGDAAELAEWRQFDVGIAETAVAEYRRSIKVYTIGAVRLEYKARAASAEATDCLATMLKR